MAYLFVFDSVDSKAARFLSLSLNNLKLKSQDYCYCREFASNIRLLVRGTELEATPSLDPKISQLQCFGLREFHILTF